MGISITSQGGDRGICVVVPAGGPSYELAQVAVFTDLRCSVRFAKVHARRKATAMPARFNVELAIVKLAVFLAPMAALRFSAIFITMSDVIFALALLVRLAKGKIPLYPFHDATRYWYAGLVLVGFGIMISSIFHGAAMDGSIMTSQYFFSYLCLPLVIMGRRYDEAVALVKVGAWSIAVICAIGIFAYVYDIRSFGHINKLVTGSGRVASLLDNPNTFASLIALYFPIMMFLVSKKEMNVIIITSLISLLLISLILSGSNSGAISCFIGIMAFILLFGSLRQVIVSIFAATAFVYATIRWGKLFLPSVFQDRVLSAVLEGDASEAGTFDFRMALIREAIGKLDNNLIIGMGADQYRPNSDLGLHVHNTYLLLTNEGGLIALIGLIVILATAARIGFSCIGVRGGRAEAAAILAAVVAIGSVMMSITHVYARFIIVPLLLLLGVAVARDRAEESTPARIE